MRSSGLVEPQRAVRLRSLANFRLAPAAIDADPRHPAMAGNRWSRFHRNNDGRVLRGVGMPAQEPEPEPAEASGPEPADGDHRVGIGVLDRRQGGQSSGIATAATRSIVFMTGTPSGKSHAPDAVIARLARLALRKIKNFSHPVNIDRCRTMSRLPSAGSVAPSQFTLNRSRVPPPSWATISQCASSVRFSSTTCTSSEYRADFGSKSP